MATLNVILTQHAIGIQPGSLQHSTQDHYDSNPQYSFSYEVNDQLTGDSKSHQESRNGDNVQGSYSLIDPDGVKRTVEYSADATSGFQATVRRDSGGTQKTQKPAQQAQFYRP